MTVSQKSALSLLISVFLFAGFTVLAFTGLFNLVETRFYNPSVTKSLGREIEKDSKTIEAFLAELQTRFSATLNETAVRRSFLPNQSAQDIFERTRVYGTLLESLAGLQSVRFIDSGGARIHFSTWPQDMLRQDRLSVAYRNYSDEPGDLPYDQIEALPSPQSPHQENTKLTLDEGSERIIFSMPFYDSFDVYRGTALFTLSVRAVTERLVGEGRIKVGEDVSLVSNPSGILTGLPGVSQDTLLSMVSSIWNEGVLSLSPLNSSAPENTLALISAKTSQGIFVGRLVHEGLFVFPAIMKIILLCSFFLTVYLIVFLFFNFRQDTTTVVQNRLKKLQISLIEQYYEHKADMDWNHWARELEQRREDIRAELKRGLRTRPEIDTLIDKSWDELLAVIGGRQNTGAAIDEEKMQTILNRILQNVPEKALPAGAPIPARIPAGLTPMGTPVAGTGAPGPVPRSVSEAEEVEEPEELRGIEEAGELEELEEAEVLEELVEEVDADDDTLPLPETAPAQPAAKPSNVRLAFGDDDIPYIIETSGLELVEENIELSAMRKEQSPAKDFNEELEELGGLEDDIEEAEEVEELEELTEELDAVEDQVPVRAPGTREGDLADLASKIEFGANPEEETEDESVDLDLEVFSPFASMAFDSGGDEESPPLSPEPVEDIPAEAPVAESPAPDAPPASPAETTDAGDDEEKKKPWESGETFNKIPPGT
ncbi:hypothetical protein AGMMS50268_06060 [Spirochaetia bacterium]|nr:hypothetical protein AGMMS50268_06060 [Spirochaetia bacterium]